MGDERKTREQLLNELAGLRQRIAKLEISEAKSKRAEQLLRESKEKYRVLVENANEAVVVAQDGMLKFFNSKAIEITGYSHGLASVPFTELIHPDDQEMVVERHLRRLGGEEFPHIYPFRIVDREGNIKWVEINAVLINWEGKPATLNFLSDITERKQAEEALKESEDKLFVVLESIAEGVCLTDLEANIVQLNSSTLRMFGYSLEEELIGRNAFEFIAEKDHAAARQNLKKTLEEGYSGIVEYTMIAKHGIEFTGELSAALLKDRSGQPTGFVAVIQDITDRKQAEERLRICSDWPDKLVEEFTLRFHEAQEQLIQKFKNDVTSMLSGDG